MTKLGDTVKVIWCARMPPSRFYCVDLVPVVGLVNARRETGVDNWNNVCYLNTEALLGILRGRELLEKA